MGDRAVSYALIWTSFVPLDTILLAECMVMDVNVLSLGTTDLDHWLNKIVALRPGNAIISFFNYINMCDQLNITIINNIRILLFYELSN